MANNYTDTNVSNMIFNILSSAKYQELLTGNLLENNQLYFVTDDNKTLTFTKSGSTIATFNGSTNVTIDLTTADKAVADSLNQTIISTYIKNLSVSGHTLTITRGNDTTSTLPLPDNDTKNTAGSTQSASKLYLIGATSQAANPQTYSSSKVYVTDDTVTAPTFVGNATSADIATKATKDAADHEIHKTYIKNANFSNNVLTLTKGDDTTFSTTLSSFPEESLTWGGPNITGNVSPIGAALSSEHSANRIAYLNPAAIQIEYTTNGGSTWTDSGYSDTEKMWLCTGSSGIAIGQSKAGYSSSTALTTNHWTRITLTGQDGTHQYVYTSPRKLLVNMSTAMAIDCIIEYKTGASGASWQTFNTTPYRVSGWSGWNDIPLILGTFGGGSTQTGNNWYLRFTFKVADTRTDNYKGYAQVYGLRLFGATDWGSASSNNGKGPFSSTGHLYSYDVNANATFPAQVTATQFNGPLNGTASKATADASGNTITSTYVKTISKTTSSHSTASPLTFYYIKGNDAEYAVTLDPPANNVTGSGTSGSLVKWNGTNTITNGPALGSDTTQFLNNKGEWAVPTGTYTLPVATYNTLGGVKPAYNWTNSATFTTPTSISGTAPTVNGREATAGRYYAIESDKDGRLFVNIPWVNTVTNYSGGNGTAPSWVFEDVPCDDITSWSAGSGSYTQGSFNGGSLTISQDSSDTKKFNIVFTAATHGADSHSHTVPTLAYTGKTASHVKSGGNGTASTWSFSKS